MKKFRLHYFFVVVVVVVMVNFLVLSKSNDLEMMHRMFDNSI
jgi:hypothetical protein